MMNRLRLWPVAFSLVSALLLWGAYPGGGEIWPLLTVALVPLFFSLSRVSGREALLCGFLTGTVHYLLQLYWIVIVLGRYGGLPVYIAVPALVLLAGYMALYVAGFALCGRLLLRQGAPLVALLGIPALWVGADWLRGWLFTGFPWMDIGYALGNVPQLIQTAELFGHGGVSFLLVLVNTFVVLALNRRHALQTLAIPALTVLVICGVAAFYSNWRWQAVSADIADPQRKSMTVGIVQGNIDQSVKWSPANQQQTVSTYLNYSTALFGETHPDLLVWPETALPFYPQTYPDTGVLYGLVTQNDTALLTGAPWFEVVDQNTKDIRYYNSAQLIEPEKGFIASYYKSHLVPFGEYVPLKKLLPFLAPLVEAVGDFSAGRVEKPLVRHEGKIGVLICFESIFPDLAREWSKNDANMLVNLTNDAWYGKSSAPYHSMAMTVFRAVENRRSVVRAANTGISGFIDPLGVIHHPSPIFTTWSAAREIVLMDGQTIFVRWGYLFPIVSLVVGLLFSLSALATKRRTING
ncbi:apolipoprotein N-acyltransferase [Desulfopila aestuarii]|uniref:Apolipoprotein N-acyltransferase n=1 Tax=Desulfopila aestuarii DSM 18488 TaxID=1121416 RepID=A0A1M7Y4K8_9BACT|nr:apolipoprotein N-acyltransferase [Desulfopila aestuarii]SHO47256.1 Apolipoprotein N-acyltransferase [Desulfopila aestuarii DSM 18488]